MRASEAKINICHLYPELMNMYGDRGNVIALCKRCEWRGISAEVHNVSTGDAFEWENYDIVFFGGGQDNDQETVYTDLREHKASGILQAVEADKAFLCICGGYQLMGKYYTMANGVRIDGIGALNIRTECGNTRLIGNLAFKCGELGCENEDDIVVGFENHSGRTYLGEGVKPLGRVVYGSGNNGEDGFEGAVYKNVICSYSHGSLLPKNYRLTDEVLRRALERKYGSESAAELMAVMPESEAEEKARITMLKRLECIK